MDFNSVNTPSDLLELNNQPTEDQNQTNPEVQDAYDALCTLDADTVVEVLKLTVEQLAVWHQSKARDAGSPEEAKAWAVDEGRLHVALLALREVTF